MPPTLVGLPPELLEAIFAFLPRVFDLKSASCACRAMLDASSVHRTALSDLRRAARYIRVHYGAAHRRSMEVVGLIAWTRRVPHEVLAPCVRAWRSTPGEWRVTLHGTPFSSYSTATKLPSGYHRVISLSVQSVVENLWIGCSR